MTMMRPGVLGLAQEQSASDTDYVLLVQNGLEAPEVCLHCAQKRNLHPQGIDFDEFVDYLFGLYAEPFLSWSEGGRGCGMSLSSSKTLVAIGLDFVTYVLIDIEFQKTAFESESMCKVDSIRLWFAELRKGKSWTGAEPPRQLPTKFFLAVYIQLNQKKLQADQAFVV